MKVSQGEICARELQAEGRQEQRACREQTTCVLGTKRKLEGLQLSKRQEVGVGVAVKVRRDEELLWGAEVWGRTLGLTLSMVETFGRVLSCRRT